MRCWEWDKAKDSLGYGRVWVNEKAMLVHRVAYEAIIGPIPAGMELDHLCRNPKCYNPEHLEAVTHAENMRRGSSFNKNKTHCPQGHLYSGRNLIIESQRYRRCRICKNAQSRAYTIRRKHE